MPLLRQHAANIVAALRFAKPIALHIAAPNLFQKYGLVTGFNAFGDHLQF